MSRVDTRAFTAEEFIEWIESRNTYINESIDDDEFFYYESLSELSWDLGRSKSEYKETGAPTPFGPMFLAEEWGGEGQGDDIGFIVEVADRFFRRTGYYSSWDGTDWDDGEWEEVIPYQVEVTKYKSVKK